MSIHKYSTIEIECDNEECSEWERADYIGQADMATFIKDARKIGWMIGRDGKVLCPKCRKLGRRKLKA